MTRLPLTEAVLKYAGGRPARFHMPGHKGLLSVCDVTEVSGTDNLQSPTEAILESERLCAEALGGRDAFFSVNGSSACNLAMLMLLGCGKTVLLGRDCHRSAISGIAVAGQETEPLFPEADGRYSPEAVDRALSRRRCDAVFITSPSYRGAVSDIAAIAEAAHSHGALLLIDCAHGAHFAFSDSLPDIPREADMWCVSAHKTLASLTQTAVLLTGNSCPYPREAVQQTMNMFQSTSPSYLFMASIERSVLEPMDWDAHFSRISRIADDIRSIKGVGLLGSPDKRKQDITRLNVSVDGLTGYDVGRMLESRRIVPEMADRECVTLITSPADKSEWYEMLLKALNEIGGAGRDKISFSSADPRRFMGERALDVRSALTGAKKLIPLEKAVGAVAAGAVGCYPPGTAVLFPGETITREAAEYLIDEAGKGAELFGSSDGMVTIVDNGVNN